MSKKPFKKVGENIQLTPEFKKFMKTYDETVCEGCPNYNTCETGSTCEIAVDRMNKGLNMGEAAIRALNHCVSVFVERNN